MYIALAVMGGVVVVTAVVMGGVVLYYWLHKDDRDENEAPVVDMPEEDPRPDIASLPPPKFVIKAVPRVPLYDGSNPLALAAKVLIAGDARERFKNTVKVPLGGWEKKAADGGASPAGADGAASLGEAVLDARHQPARARHRRHPRPPRRAHRGVRPSPRRELQTFELLGYPPTTNYAFLGDIVDRGPQQLETITLIYSYMVRERRRGVGDGFSWHTRRTSS